MSRFARALGSAVVGALFAGAYLIGILVGTGTDPVAPEPEALRLGAYCRHLHGGRADGYQPDDIGEWRCSVWRNGVWGLEEVDLAAACRWQFGRGAQPVTRGGRTGGKVRLLCTL